VICRRVDLRAARVRRVQQVRSDLIRFRMAANRMPGLVMLDSAVYEHHRVGARELDAAGGWPCTEQMACGW